MTRKLVLIAIATAVAVLSAEAESYSDGTTQLSKDTECSSLSLSSGAVVDLNGYNLIFAGTTEDFSPTSGCVITNSSETAATVSFTASSGKWGSQFKNVVFGGNLTLKVSGNTNSNDGFQGVTNTHTGGTVLDGYSDSNASKYARVNTNGALPGELTLANGTTIRYTDGTAPNWTKVVVTGSETNILVHEKAMTTAAAFAIADGATLRWEKKASTTQQLTGDMSAVTGTLYLVNAGDSVYISNDDGIPNGTLSLDGANTYHRNGSGNETKWTLGALEGTSGSKLMYVGGLGTLPLVIGSKGVDTTFAGWIAYDGGGDWSVEKVGTGTLTLTGDNTYRGETTISAGAVALGGTGSLYSNGTVVFNGGSLAFADDYSAGSFSQTLVATNNALKVNVADGVAVTNTASVGSITSAIEKKGEGTFVFDNAFSNSADPFRNSALTNYVYGVLEMPMPTDGTPGLASKLIGDGTLRFTGGSDNKGYRLNNSATAEALSEFEGTIDWNYSGTASTAIGFVFADDKAKSWPSLRWSITGEPSAERVVCHMEKSADLTLKGFDILHTNAQVSVKNAKNLYFGASGEDSTLNGQFVTSAIYLHKSGTGKLTLGPGFSTVSGSTLGVEAGVLELASGATYDGVTNVCTVTIASGVALTGDGVFGAVDLSVNDVVAPDASTFTNKTAEYAILTATLFSNVSLSSNLSTLLATLNEGETKGKWKVRQISNGDGTVTLKVVYSKNAFVIILR